MPAGERRSGAVENTTPASFLGGDAIIQVENHAVVTLAQQLRQQAGGDVAFAEAAFEWVRDQVAHSYDVQDPRVTLTAAEVLQHRVGLCYAKSHLLTAVLRSQGVPTGLCYQRLTHVDGFVLHGLVAIYLNGAWHRQDPRGNTGDVDAQFSLGSEQLAWKVLHSAGEVDYPQIFTYPAQCVVEALRNSGDALELYNTGLPERL